MGGQAGPEKEDRDRPFPNSLAVQLSIEKRAFTNKKVLIFRASLSLPSSFARNGDPARAPGARGAFPLGPARVRAAVAVPAAHGRGAGPAARALRPERAVLEAELHRSQREAGDEEQVQKGQAAPLRGRKSFCGSVVRLPMSPSARTRGGVP